MTRVRPSLLAQRLDRSESDVWAIHERAVARRAAGEDVILLTVGDPDFPTPTPICNYAAERLAAERTHYSPAAGEPELRRTVAALESQIEGRAFDAEQVVIYPGATAALMVTFACVADPGDEVVVPEPMYLGYPGIFEVLGVDLRRVPLDAASGFPLDVDAVMAACGPRTRAVLINTPGNPVGNMIDAPTLATLAERCLDAGLWLVCDEVYSLMTFAGRHTSLLRAAASLENVVVIDGLSKSHAMAGWRVGWSVSSSALAKTMGAVAGSVFFGCSQFVQDAAAFALSRDEPYVAAMRDEYRGRRDLVIERLAEVAGLRCHEPAAGMFVMVDVGGLAPDGEVFAERMLEQAGVALLPGRHFGANAATYVRLSLTQPRPVLDEALGRLAEACRATTPN